MSNLTLGQGIGIVAGAVLGYFTGGAGWYLAGSILLGASAGYAIGTAIDPAAPDIPGAGQSATGELDVTLADEGIVIPDALGTVKVNGNIFWYGGSRVVEIKEKVSGGKGGGSKKVVTGYKYYLSWAMGLCLGPVDELITIFSNNEPVWSGNELLTDASNGTTTITLDEIGTLVFYFGDSSHVANADILSLISSELGQTYNPPYKNLCWVFFNDCSLGNYNRVPTFKFIIRKSPVLSFNSSNMIGVYDYNPAHAIYYLLATATELSSDMIDEDSFSTVADALLLEGRGIAIYFGDERKTITYIESLVTHINAILQFEADGKFHLTLIRDDVDVDDMPSFSEEDFVEPIAIKRPSWTETNNDIKVQYAKRINIPFGDSVDLIENPDVYVMGFIDESTNSSCQVTYGGYCQSDYPADYGLITNGSACPQWTIDTELYFDGLVAKEKTWLLEGSYHISALNRLQDNTGHYRPIAPDGSVPSVYANYFNPFGNVSLWANQVALWQQQFQILIYLGRGKFVPGSVLRIYVDTSSLGGIEVLEPAYSQFKSWVLLNYGGLVYLEYENDTEAWIEMLHEDLTPWGYGS